MPSDVALALGVALIACLLRLERRNRDTSAAVWIPTVWLLLSGSKPLGRWTDMTPSIATQEEGSPLDRLVLSILIALALVVLTKRRVHWSAILRENKALFLLLLYLGFSVAWSDFPMVSLKRWIRLCGAVPVGLVLVTERSPFQALESALRRCAYVLLPLSLVLVKYFIAFGVQYSPWEGTLQWVGVASQKNSLGVICSLSAFVIVWTYVRDWNRGVWFSNGLSAIADGLVLAMALFLLGGYGGTYPATAIGIILAGVAILLLLSRLKRSLKTVATLIVLTVAFGLIFLALGESMVGLVTSVFQRDASFTGRTDIWHAVLVVAGRRPIFGYGFGGYWGLQDEEISSKLLIHESHSGYLDVYLEAGLVGVALLLVFLTGFYRRALKQVNETPEWGWFAICVLTMTLIHNFTESNFLRTSSYFWNSLVFLSLTLTTGPIPARSAPTLSTTPNAPPRRWARTLRPVGDVKLVRRD